MTRSGGIYPLSTQKMITARNSSFSLIEQKHMKLHSDQYNLFKSTGQLLPPNNNTLDKNETNNNNQDNTSIVGEEEVQEERSPLVVPERNYKKQTAEETPNTQQ